MPTLNIYILGWRCGMMVRAIREQYFITIDKGKSRTACEAQGQPDKLLNTTDMDYWRRCAGKFRFETLY